MTYTNNGKSYRVDSVSYRGAIVNVNGTSITDCATMAKAMHSRYAADGYSVFVDGDELAFRTFDEAYAFATTKQKDTCRL